MEVVDSCYISFWYSTKYAVAMKTKLSSMPNPRKPYARLGRYALRVLVNIMYNPRIPSA